MQSACGGHCRFRLHLPSHQAGRNKGSQAAHPHCSPPLGPPPGLRPGLMRPGLLYRAAMEGATFTLLAGMLRMRDYGLAAT